MRALLALFACTASVWAQTDDNQRVLGQPPTEADMATLVRKLTMHDLKEFKGFELLKQLEALREDPKRMAELRKDPAKVEALLDQLPKPLVAEAMRRMQPPSNPFRDVDPPMTPSLEPGEPAVAEQPTRLNFDPPPLAGRPAQTNLQNNPSVRNLIRLWEKNVGPLEKTPALKKAFTELLKSSMNGKDSSSPLFDDDRLNSLLDPDSALGKEMSQWLDQAANGSSWKWSDLGLGDLNLSLPEASLPSGPGSSGGSGDSQGSFSLLTPLLAAAALAVIVVVLRHYGLLGTKKTVLGAASSRALFDPASIADRPSLVAAFELCSLQTLGSDARVWNHRTIADELTRRMTVSDETAWEASRLYEIARYSPPGEPLTPESYLAARRCLVKLCEATPR